MAFLAWVARPIDDTLHAQMEREILWHFTLASRREQIVIGDVADDGDDAFGTHVVQLSAENGWQWNYRKLVRDWTVFDPRNFKRQNYMRYIYFFLGEPAFSARKKNGVHECKLVIRVRGADVAAHGRDRIFFRPKDQVVVLRGEYRGRAAVTLQGGTG